MYLYIDIYNRTKKMNIHIHIIACKQTQIHLKRKIKINTVVTYHIKEEKNGKQNRKIIDTLN